VHGILSACSGDCADGFVRINDNSPCGLYYIHCTCYLLTLPLAIETAADFQLSLDTPPWVGEMSTSDGYGYRKGQVKTASSV